ncbi:MAG: FixH family protein [Betaproteobacteria bacterium]|nr:MAG: FixH family protein [Betaproteobacteria bacterium]
MNMRVITKQTVPWYREPWPWIVFAIPGVAVLAGIVTLIIAIVHRDGLVAEDYYKQGLAINRVLEREARAAQMGLEGQVMVADSNIRVTIAGTDAFPDALVVRFIHPTRAGEDQEIVLAAMSPGLYEGSMPGLARGRWYVQLEDAQATWRLRGNWTTDQQSSSIGAAAQY